MLGVPNCSLIPMNIQHQCAVSVSGEHATCGMEKPDYFYKVKRPVTRA